MRLSQVGCKLKRLVAGTLGLSQIHVAGIEVHISKAVGIGDTRPGTSEFRFYVYGLGEHLPGIDIVLGGVLGKIAQTTQEKIVGFWVYLLLGRLCAFVLRKGSGPWQLNSLFLSEFQKYPPASDHTGATTGDIHPGVDQLSGDSQVVSGSDARYLPALFVP